jgi:hypothetical protein
MLLASNATAQQYQCQLRVYGNDYTNRLFGKVQSITKEGFNYELNSDKLLPKPKQAGDNKAIWQFDAAKKVVDVKKYNEVDSLIDHQQFTYQKNKALTETKHIRIYNENRKNMLDQFENIIYKYDTAGLLLTETRGYKDSINAKYRYNESIIYHYTPKQLIAFTKVVSETYSYDNKRNIIQKKYSDADQSATSSIHNYKYDKRNREIEWQYIGSSGLLRYCDQYNYNKNNTLNWVRMYANVTDGNYDFIAHFKYNKKGDIVKNTCQHTLPEVKTSIYTYTYEYDSHKNWTKRTEIKDSKKATIVTRKINYYL